MTRNEHYSFSAEQFDTLERICEHVVPGSGPCGPAVYIDSVAADLEAAQRLSLISCLDDAKSLLDADGDLSQIATRPWFGWLRALAIEAYYSDFRQPGYAGPGAWEAIGFTSAPMAARAKQDWSFLRCFEEVEHARAT